MMPRPSDDPGRDDEGFEAAHPEMCASDEPAVRSWPTDPAPAAFHGIFGEMVALLDPHTEADPVALLASSLTMFGSLIGRNPYFGVEADKHFGNLFVVLVGATSKGRKGTSHGQVARVMADIDTYWKEHCRVGGLSTGEGLIHAVRDGDEHDEDEDEDYDRGVADKRLMVNEPEFASVLKVMTREGNTLSPALRQAWDSGRLHILTKNNPAKATDAHVSIIGHITIPELLRHLGSDSAANGFGNRVLWICVRRSKELPFGGSLTDEDLAELKLKMASAIGFGRSLQGARVHFAPAAAELWASVYHDLSDGRPGLLGAMTGRAEAQVCRLALLYAVADRSRLIERPHLEAALALWLYSADSAEYIFGDSMGDPLADEIRRLLDRAGDEGMDRQALRDAFGKHRGGAEMAAALGRLESSGMARMESIATAGRPREVWYAMRRKRPKRPKPPAETLPSLPSLPSRSNAKPEPAPGDPPVPSPAVVEPRRPAVHRGGVDYYVGDTLPTGQVVLDDGVLSMRKGASACE